MKIFIAIILSLAFILLNIILFNIAPFIDDFLQSNGQVVLFLFIFCNIMSIVAILNYYTNKKKLRVGEEHGSAAFTTIKKFKKIANKKNPMSSIVLANNIQLSLDHRKVQRNLNVLVVGGPGTGKTQFVVNPNLCQMGSNYIITDPKGEILAGAGTMLRKAGYKIKVLNLDEMSESDYYNPFKYLRQDRDEDVLTLIDTIVKNTDGPDKKSSDPFWEKAEALFLQSLFFYVVYKEPEHRKNIGSIIEYLGKAQYELEPGQKNEIDQMFEELEQENPGHIAVASYKLFRASSKETLKSIVITANARFGPFAISAVKNLFSYDTFELDKIDEQKNALFLIIKPTKTKFNFIGAMFYTQVFSQLDYIANEVNKKKYGELTLRIPTLFILDEFANIGKIPDFEKILSYARSLNIGIFPILQNLNQLKEMYKDSWETIVGSCDSFIFLGANDNFTLEYITKKIGKQTIDNINNSRSYGKNGNRSKSEQILGRDLMTPDEIAAMEFSEMLLFVKGLRTYKGKKYNLTKHPNFNKLLRGGGKIYKHKIPTKPTYVYSHSINISSIKEFFDEIGEVTAMMENAQIAEQEQIEKNKNNKSKQDKQSNKLDNSQGENIYVEDTKINREEEHYEQNYEEGFEPGYDDTEQIDEIDGLLMWEESEYI